MRTPLPTKLLKKHIKALAAGVQWMRDVYEHCPEEHRKAEREKIRVATEALKILRARSDP